MKEPTQIFLDKTIEGDYGVEAAVTTEDVERMIEQTRKFRQQGRHSLGVVP